MRTFHDQLRGIGSLPAATTGEGSLTFPRPRASVGSRGYSPEARHSETPSGGDVVPELLHERHVLQSRGQNPLGALSPYAVLFCSTVLISHQLGSASGQPVPLLPSLVGATLRQLPEIHAGTGASPSPAGTNLPHPTGVEPHDSSNSDRRAQSRRLSAALAALRKAVEALREADDLKVERYGRKLIKHASHLCAQHRELIDPNIRAFESVLSDYLQAGEQTPALLEVRDSLRSLLMGTLAQ